MKAKPRQSGLTLTEMVVVVAAVALLTGLGLPAIRTLFNSMATSGGTRAMISAALASARAIAAKEQRYAGVRFQEDLYGRQYMIFIIQDSRIGAYFFRAVEGLQPIKLPDSIGVMDVGFIETDTDIDNDVPKLINATTFSIVFSPSGKLVIHDVQVRNRDGIYMPDNSVPAKVSMDDVFNSGDNIRNYNVGMFIQDDYPSDGLDKELSRNSFVIYDKVQFGKINTTSRWSDYLSGLEVIYINPYTGTIIKR